MSHTVLITGGTGLIGTRLTQLLQQKGYEVRYFSRFPGKAKGVEAFSWNLEKQVLDARAFEGVDVIIHLAGADVAEKRWTAKRKKEILHSRTRSIALLRSFLENNAHGVKVFISASGTNYYGHDRGDLLLTEESTSGDGFLAEVTRAWENEAMLVKQLNIRTVLIRTGIVLSKKSGALPRLARPVRFGVGAPLGTGHQVMSWIHIDDLCQIYLHLLEHRNCTGIFNAVSPHPVTNREFTRVLAGVLHRPLILPAVPGFILRLLVGEMSEMVLGGLYVSPEKILNEGYRFRFSDLKTALEDIYNKT